MASDYIVQRVKAIEESVYGRETREPIADGLQQIGISGNRQIVNIKDDIIGRGKDKRDEAFNSCQEFMTELADVETEQGKRVVTVIPEQIIDDYFTLVITRANGH